MMAQRGEEGTGTAAALRASTWPARPAPRSSDNATSNQAWFIGFAPVDNPQMAIAVTVERTPGPGRHGGRADRQAGDARPCWRCSVTEVADNTRRRRPLPDPATGSAPAGMADVYCAEDTHLGREVALKVLHRRFAQDAGVRRALPPRGVVRRRPPAPERRRRLRPRRARRHLLHRDGVPARADAQGHRRRARRRSTRSARSTSASRSSRRRASRTGAASSTATSSRTT